MMDLGEMNVCGSCLGKKRNQTIQQRKKGKKKSLVDHVSHSIGLVSGGRTTLACCSPP